MKSVIELCNQSLGIIPTSLPEIGSHTICLSDHSLNKMWHVTVPGERLARDIAADFLDDGRSGILFEYFPQVLEEIKNVHSNYS